MNKHDTPTEIDSRINENDFATAVDKAQMPFTPAFVHGLLTAYCGQVPNPHGWVKALIDEIEPENLTQTTQLRFFNEAKNVIGTQLSDSELSFELLLNNTAESLHDEVLLTREWASGYSLGIQTTGTDEQIADDEISTDFLSDLASITAMPLPDEEDLEVASIADDYSDEYDEAQDVYDADTGDDTRVDVMQIQEYLRAGAISVFLASWKEDLSEEDDEELV